MDYVSINKNYLHYFPVQPFLDYTKSQKNVGFLSNTFLKPAKIRTMIIHINRHTKNPKDTNGDLQIHTNTDQTLPWREGCSFKGKHAKRKMGVSVIPNLAVVIHNQAAKRTCHQPSSVFHELSNKPSSQENQLPSLYAMKTITHSVSR